MGIRAFLKSEYLVQLLFSSISWEHIIRFVFIVEVFAVMSIFMFFYVMYPKDAHRMPLWITMVYSALLLVYFLVSPTEQFTSTMLLHWSGYLLILLYCVPYLSIVSFFRRREGAVINVLGLMLISTATLNDLLYYADVIDSVPLSPFAVLGFIFIQAINIAFKYSALFQSNLRLTTDLETIVAEQTKELRQSNEQLLEFDQQRTKLLENIAHDLGSPLAGMKTHLYALKIGESESKQQKRLISQMQMNVDNMSRQVEDLYDMTGIERNAAILNLELISLRELREAIAGLLQQKVEWEQIEVSWFTGATVVDEQAEVVEVNLQGILRVVQNYLDNAIKFSFDDPCQIEIEWTIADGQLQFELTDFGKGISAEELPRVFERFYKGEEKRKGIGLGLSIAKDIIEQQGGTVGVRSQYGKGSTFSFRLPLLKKG
jgi:signal transduction histidine kinase